MKTKLLSSLLALSILLFSTISCKSQTSNFNDKEIISMLNDFYTGYITERSKMPEDFKKIDLIIERYCTKELQSQLRDEDIDYDLLLNGQFCEKEWLNTMSIKKDSNDHSVYNVTFEYISNNISKLKTIRLQIMRNDSGYKINKVIE